MFGITSKVESAASAVVRGFESIPARLLTLGKHVEAAIAYPFTPDAVKSALPLLLDVIEDMRQELAELRKPCPCAPAATFTSAVATENAGQVVPTLAEDMTAKWPTYDLALAAFSAGQMSEDEAAVFKVTHDKVVAFAASLGA